MGSERHVTNRGGTTRKSANGLSALAPDYAA